MEYNKECQPLDDNLLKYVYDEFKKMHYLTTDSRKVIRGSIFVALKGEHVDANIYAQQALDAGASLVIIDNAEYYIDERTVLVEDALLFLQKFANYYRKTFKIPFIAISGTNGKTTTKELINAVLAKKYKTHATYGNLNNQIGVPLTLLSMKSDCEIAIIEMGASHTGDLTELCAIAEPDMVILTNIGTAHIEGFGSLEGVTQAKTELFRYAESINGKIFANIDDENIRNNTPQTATTFSLQQKADITAQVVKSESAFAELIYEDVKIKSRLVGSYNCYNILAALTIGLYFGVSLGDIKTAVEDYVPSNNRSQIKKTQKNTLILDCYNANPSSCMYALEAFDSIKASDKRVFIGAMKELGNTTDKQHRIIAEKVMSMNLKQAVFVGGEYRNIVKSYNALWFENSNEAKEFMSTQDIHDALIFIKGSRATQMERIADAL
ncbi:MAG: UDP-N-acetylmuramoyl-tripeptide--D-alanyl-D-alanine ligase [Bacteroidales bacterium]|nr:UDP-N-acetylmuramoyl-tripeptide--D-alanyl-D-alanine ligase [Bacteroidales bacterium]